MKCLALSHKKLRVISINPHFCLRNIQFIVQSLVGNASWSSVTRSGKFYHVGTIPNKKSNTFVSDLRMMVTGEKRMKTWDIERQF